MSIADRINSSLDRLGWSQHDLARTAGVQQATISRIITGKSEPFRGTMAKLAKALGVSPAWLASGEKPQEPAADLASEVRKVLAEVAASARVDHLANALDRHSAASLPGECGRVSLPAGATMVGPLPPIEPFREPVYALTVEGAADAGGLAVAGGRAGRVAPPMEAGGPSLLLPLDGSAPMKLVAGSVRLIVGLIGAGAVATS